MTSNLERFPKALDNYTVRLRYMSEQCQVESTAEMLNVCVTVVEVPSSPFDVRLVSCSARVVQLEWKHVSNDVNATSSAALQFIIEYNTSFEPDTWQVCHVTHLPGASQSVTHLVCCPCGRAVLSQSSWFMTQYWATAAGSVMTTTKSSHVYSTDVTWRNWSCSAISERPSHCWLLPLIASLLESTSNCDGR